MNAGGTAGDLHSFQHPDVPVPSLRENIAPLGPQQMMISFCSVVKWPHDWTPSLRRDQQVRVSPEPPLFIGCTDSWDVLLQVSVSVSLK